MTDLNQPTTADIVEGACYTSIMYHNPKMITEIEAFLDEGGTAKQLEKKLTRGYGRKNEVINTIILAAYYVEKQRKQVRKEPTDDR